MHWTVPFLLLFGFLSGFAPHDESFELIMPVVAIIGLAPFVWTAWQANLRVLLGISTVIFLVLALAVTPAFSALALSVGAGAVVLASKFGRSLGGQLLIGGISGLMASLVVEPAGLALGLWRHAAPGLYYDFSPIAMLSWFCITAAGCAIALRAQKNIIDLPIGLTTSAISVLAFTTGVCLAFGLWPAALLGLVLLQFGFHVLHYV